MIDEDMINALAGFKVRNMAKPQPFAELCKAINIAAAFESFQKAGGDFRSCFQYLDFFLAPECYNQRDAMTLITHMEGMLGAQAKVNGSL